MGSGGIEEGFGEVGGTFEGVLGAAKGRRVRERKKGKVMKDNAHIVDDSSHAIRSAEPVLRTVAHERVSVGRRRREKQNERLELLNALASVEESGRTVESEGSRLGLDEDVMSGEEAKYTSCGREWVSREDEERGGKATSPNFEGSIVLDFASSSAVSDLTPFLEASRSVSTT